MGKSIVNQGDKSLPIVYTALYSFQIFAWCTSLICLACIRMADHDPTHGFDIQSPKRRSGAHTIDGAHKRKSRISQRLFGFRHSSSIAPIVPKPDGPDSKHSEKKMDSLHHATLQLIGQPELVAPQHMDVIDARRVTVHHNFDLGDIKLEKSGESLSDMLFKGFPPSPQTEKGFKVPPKEPMVRVSIETGHTDGDTQGGSPTLSTASTLEDFGNDPAPKDPEVVATMDNAQPMDLESTKNASSTPVIPTRRSSIHHKSQPRQVEEPREPLPVPSVVVTHVYDSEEEMSNVQNKSDDINAQSDSIPDVQPDLYEAIAQATSTLVDIPAPPEISVTHYNTTFDQDLAYTPPKSPSIQPLRSTDKPTPSIPRLSSASFRKRHSSPALQMPTINIPVIVLHPSEEDDEPVRVLTDVDIEFLTTMPPTPLRASSPQWEEEEEEYFDEDYNDGYDFDDYHHPPYDYGDDEFGQTEVYEQQQEEEYVQEIEEYVQEEEYAQEEDENVLENDDEALDQDDGFRQKEQVGVIPKGPTLEGEYDPYALDVPINLAIDLQALEQGDAKNGYGYI
ncbi:hypothetical protein B0O80DRAFT_278278 [Mortierella sp. GBAus27b]|nr:hypothetical protein B0O80DRAFT_278278 [Mortierella sp. GBAus27b]